VRALSGWLSICTHCKKMRDDQGYRQAIESYISERSEAEFSHGLCPACMKELYPEYYDQVSSMTSPSKAPDEGER